MSDHWKGCWRYHPACAIARVMALEAELERRTAPTKSAGQCTHDAFTPMTHHGPTWGAPCDDPPSYTP